MALAAPRGYASGIIRLVGPSTHASQIGVRVVGVKRSGRRTLRLGKDAAEANYARSKVIRSVPSPIATSLRKPSDSLKARRNTSPSLQLVSPLLAVRTLYSANFSRACGGSIRQQLITIFGGGVALVVAALGSKLEHQSLPSHFVGYQSLPHGSGRSHKLEH